MSKNNSGIPRKETNYNKKQSWKLPALVTSNKFSVSANLSYSKAIWILQTYVKQSQFGHINVIKSITLNSKYIEAETYKTTVSLSLFYGSESWVLFLVITTKNHSRDEILQNHKGELKGYKIRLVEIRT